LRSIERLQAPVLAPQFAHWMVWHGQGPHGTVKLG
jgi:hypothetical protein